MPTTSLKDTTSTSSIIYDGFQFGGDSSTPPSYRLRGEPIYDDAKRTVTHVRYTLEVSTILYAAAEDTTAGFVQDARATLSRPGKKLELLELGLGDTTVEAGGSHPDLLWGARPQVIALSPIGGTLAWQLDWQCEFNVSEPGVDGENGWLAFNFTMAYSIDDHGQTTRTAKGYVQIAQVRGAHGRTTVRRSVDAARERVRIHVPQGFRRLRSHWEESTDKTRLLFEVVDEQLQGDAFPPGIIDGEVEYRLENQGDNFTQSRAIVSGWLESAPGVAKSTALLRLLAIADDKALRLRAAAPASSWFAVVPSQFSLRREIFGRKTWIHCEYQLVGCVSAFLSVGGVFSPVPGSDYRRWRASVEHLWGNRGEARLKSRTGDDLIIDLIDRPTRQVDIGRSQSASVGDAQIASTSLFFRQVSEGIDWLRYHVKVRGRRRENVSLHALAREVKSSANQSTRGLGSSYQSSGSGAGIVREVHGEPFQQIILEGEATRLSLRPNAPALISVGGRQVFERERSEELEQTGTYCGYPAITLRWSITYDVCGYVASLSPPENSSSPQEERDLSL